MLQGEMPFGSWRESELTFARIAKGQLTLPHTFSPEAVDLITKVSPGLKELIALYIRGLELEKWLIIYYDLEMRYFLIHDSILFVLQTNSKAIDFLLYKFSNFLVSFPVS